MNELSFLGILLMGNILALGLMVAIAGLVYFLRGQKKPFWKKVR